MSEVVRIAVPVLGIHEGREWIDGEYSARLFGFDDPAFALETYVDASHRCECFVGVAVHTILGGLEVMTADFQTTAIDEAGVYQLKAKSPLAGVSLNIVKGEMSDA